jgi:uncharacterized protein (DUF169 family)
VSPERPCARLLESVGHLSLPAPVGVQVLNAPRQHSDIPEYDGVSYCDAVRRAGGGEALRVTPGSIEVCRWAPVVLGLKAPEGRFEESLMPRLDYPVAGLLLAPLDAFPGNPQVVIVRASRETLEHMILLVGQDQLWKGASATVDRSAVSLFTGGQHHGRHQLVSAINRPLAALASSERWQALTHRIFQSRRATAAFEAIISRTLADMSVCRNSTVIPLTTGQANISHFCTGGITWGRNRPDHLTSGWPCRFPLDP